MATTDIGIIGGALPEADQYKAPKIKPVTTEVDPNQETVESRLNKMTAGGSRYTELAKKDAQRSANTRGLINSSMAGAAGTEAAIKAAMPIAQQDAKTYTQTRLQNQGDENEFLKNRQSANLNMETAGHASQLRQGEAEQASGLKMGEMGYGSELTNQENTLLADLQMKRDQGLSTLTQEENDQLNALEMKRDKALSGQRITEATAENQLQINRDKNSAELNQQLSILESDLKQNEMVLDNELRTGFEKALQDDRFSDEAKMNIVSTMSNILRDTQEQITQVGLSDRSAAQQEAAIKMIEQNRDAELAVYQDLLGSFNDWQWNTDFTPKSGSGATGTTSGTSSYVAPTSSDKSSPPSGDAVQVRGFHGNLTNQWKSSDGKWRWSDNQQQWYPVY